MYKYKKCVITWSDREILCIPRYARSGVIEEYPSLSTNRLEELRFPALYIHSY